MNKFQNVKIRLLQSDGTSSDAPQKTFSLEVKVDDQLTVLKATTENGDVNYRTVLNKNTKGFQLGGQSFVLKMDPNPLVLNFNSKEDLDKFCQIFSKTTKQTAGKLNTFDERTEEASSSQYFQFYGYLSQQQNMMQDYIRTSTYQSAILQNASEFKDKVVLDVGAGTGILSFFAVQAGAKKVYAIEASNMAKHAKELIAHNKLSNVIEVKYGKVEEIELPEKVDIIISEPMGYMLFNERMLETYLHAKKWLKPGGNMYPTRGDLYVAPFTDDNLFMEHFARSNFWCQNSFYNVNLTQIRQNAVEEYFRQPIVDTFDVRILMAKPILHVTDFLTASEESLQKIYIPLKYTMLMTGTLHGLAFWFEVGFLGKISHVYLSTAPQEPLTHWYQVRCLFPNPVFVRSGQQISGTVVLHANERQSYDVEMEIVLDGTGVRTSNILDLKNPYFRYTGVQPSPPPGSSTSPTEQYWNNTTGPVVNGATALNTSTSTVFPGQPSHSVVGGVSAFTSQSAGGVMATGSASSQQIGYSEQHVPADRRYILQNPGNVPVHDDRGVYMVPGMSG